MARNLLAKNYQIFALRSFDVAAFHTHTRIRTQKTFCERCRIFKRTDFHDRGAIVEVTMLVERPLVSCSKFIVASIFTVCVQLSVKQFSLSTIYVVLVQ